MSAKAIQGDHALICSECRHVFLNYGEYMGDIVAGDGHFTCPNCGVEFNE